MKSRGGYLKKKTFALIGEKIISAIIIIIIIIIIVLIIITIIMLPGRNL